MEKTQPKIFHIHIDGIKEIPEELELFVINELGFISRPFNGHPGDADHFEPGCELTFKSYSKEDFKNTWDKLLIKLKQFPDFVGYVEGEYIPLDDFIPYKEYTHLPIPFKATKRKLTSAEKFRQTEVHLTMDKNTSHPDLIKKLLDAGLYGGYIPKENAEYVVFTMQGYIKDIVHFIPVLKKFIEDSGGADKCTIKEERAIAHTLSNITTSELPQILDSIKYLTNNNTQNLNSHSHITN